MVFFLFSLNRTMTFDALPLYNPTKEMKMLITNNFDCTDLNSKAKALMLQIE